MYMYFLLSYPSLLTCFLVCCLMCKLLLSTGVPVVVSEDDFYKVDIKPIETAGVKKKCKLPSADLNHKCSIIKLVWLHGMHGSMAARLVSL